MPFAIRFEPSTDAYADVRLWGRLTRDEFDEASTALLSVLGEWSRVLFDASALENAGEALTMFLRSEVRDQMPSGVRQAAVVGPKAAAVARSWIRAASPGSAGTQAFSARDAAIAWLLGDYQATTGGS